jgi:hypothetical protein
MRQAEFVEKIKPHILCSVNVFENLTVYDYNVEKYWRAGQAADDYIKHAHCMLDT